MQHIQYLVKIVILVSRGLGLKATNNLLDLSTQTAYNIIY